MSWRKGTPFTPDEDATVRKMLSAGQSRLEIQKALNRTKSSVESRISKLGLSKPLAPVYTHRSDLRPARTCELTPALVLGAGDHRYVRACLAQGGFVYTTQLPDGRYVTVRP